MFDREAATLALDGSPPIPRITFPTCRAHYPGGSSGCSCRLLPRSCGLPPMAGVRASSAFRSVVCENIPNIAPHIAANIMMGMVCLRLHSEHQLSRGLRSSIQNRSSTNIILYKIAHCNPLRSKLGLPYSEEPDTGPRHHRIVSQERIFCYHTSFRG
jgi:hypothetical protein